MLFWQSKLLERLQPREYDRGAGQWKKGRINREVGTGNHLPILLSVKWWINETILCAWSPNKFNAVQ